MFKMKGIYRKGEARKQLRDKRKRLVLGQDTSFRRTAGALHADGPCSSERWRRLTKQIPALMLTRKFQTS